MEMWSTAHFAATHSKTNVSNSSQIDSAKHLIVVSSDSQYPCLTLTPWELHFSRSERELAREAWGTAPGPTGIPPSRM